MNAEQESELDNARAALLEAGRRLHTLENRVSAQRMVTALDTLRRERDAMQRSLHNVRMLSQRMARKPETKENAGHLLRFCAEAGVVGSVLRDEHDGERGADAKR